MSIERWARKQIFGGGMKLIGKISGNEGAVALGNIIQGRYPTGETNTNNKNTPEKILNQGVDLVGHIANQMNPINKIVDSINQDKPKEEQIQKPSEIIPSSKEVIENATGTVTETPTGTETETPTEKAESNLKKLWEREDAIRKETQEREDSAYQRAVADMRKAGINPNLVGINPAQSGGGITQASQMESTLGATISSTTQQIIAELEREMDVKENQKDRITDIVSSALMALLLRR